MNETTPQVKARLLSLLKWESKTAAIILAIVALFFLSALMYANQYQDRFLPNTFIKGVLVEGLTRDEAVNELTNTYKSPNEFFVTLAVDDISTTISSSDMEIHYPIEKTVDAAFTQSRFKNQWLLLFSLIQSYFYPHTYALSPEFSDEKIMQAAFDLKQQVDIEGVEPSATLKQSGVPSTITIDPGSFGRSVDATSAAQLTSKIILSEEFTNQMVAAPVASTSMELNQEEQDVARTRAGQFVGKEIRLEYQEFGFELTDQDIISTLALPNGVRQEILESLISEFATKINREPVNAHFEFNQETNDVIAFQPHRNGISVDVTQTTSEVANIINKIDESIQIEESQSNESDTESEPQTEWVVALVAGETSPETTLADTNSLGITERIGFGESNYNGSIPNRVHNVTVTSERINNALVAPGEEFSFNKELGDISRATGFRPAYVIRSGRTELGDGGGVCQVSSTLFRALLDSGLNISKRLQHSYRVGYYEQNSEPGFDATVYSGNVDLRFINDTEHHVLVHTRVNEADRYLAIELFGTSDGRSTEISGYEKWGFVSALPTEYYPDPSLAPGQLKQIDWAVAGLKTKFTHTVRDKDGNVMREDEYYSNYRPWAAKFLQGV